MCCRELRLFDGPATRAAAYDASGQFLAVGGPELRVVAGPKQDWAGVGAWADLPKKKGVLSVAWGHLGRSLLVGSGDHNLRLYGAAAGGGA